ncbi:hypothetical protein F2P81_019885 [Scophthalmus maximus]|uniref:Uncharacterized protein n=1 Tax=Scophthalmus maximus TaxID=52904 RepID=A0A6A4S915_SCOMX|nr:hypothetical protein F2P81_019885 [Scophthalmus maximus]
MHRPEIRSNRQTFSFALKDAFVERTCVDPVQEMLCRYTTTARRDDVTLLMTHSPLNPLFKKSKALTAQLCQAAGRVEGFYSDYCRISG